MGYAAFFFYTFIENIKMVIGGRAEDFLNQYLPREMKKGMTHMFRKG